METKYFVTMTDKTLSGWGNATGKIHKQIVECQTLRQAKLFVKGIIRIKDANGFRYINIVDKKPYYNASRYTSTTRPVTDFTIIKSHLSQDEVNEIWNA